MIEKSDSKKEKKSVTRKKIKFANDHFIFLKLSEQ